MSELASTPLAEVELEDVLPSTEDLLHRVLPLFRQVAALHEAGRVAPLDGLAALRVSEGLLYFESAAARAMTTAFETIERLEPSPELWVDVVSRQRETRSETGARRVEDLSVWRGDAAHEAPTAPSFVVGPDAWERLHGHHDPLTDIHLLGLHTARLATGLALEDPEELETFVAARDDLRALNPALHPVVARALREMTEPVRSRRPADLPSLIRTLENHREHQVDGLGDLPSDAAKGAQQAICERLRNRLFDLSRRNRLLHFRPSGKTLDLTVASIPLVLDHRSVDPDRLAIWRPAFSKKLAAGKAISLASLLRFEDYPFVPKSLDAIRLQAGRDEREYGFSQLRLVACFLHWHDLKEAEHERIRSPLLLVPVSVTKKKGVRDTYVLQATGTEMEVNPVLRHRLQQLYAIELPETVPLGDEAALNALYESLRDQIQASEPAVSLERIDKPRIRMISALAKRRLETFRRRSRRSGRVARGGRRFEGIDYSYRKADYAPLGIQLFQQKVVPLGAPDRHVLDTPRPRPFQLGPGEREARKDLYSLEGGGGGPHRWAFDLCSLTLANFNTKKMSLVADYATLLDEPAAAPPSFEALFRPDARPLPKAAEPLPLADQHTVVPADPTQLAAIARSRDGESYIVQGPPGTGKSQTITNLIADHVARGERVLFVCEKRVAIDVVYRRLAQLGLAPLCCLIHDSQGDKKDFIHDLKATYEAWLPAAEAPPSRPDSPPALSEALAPLAARWSAMRSKASGSDETLGALVARLAELDEAAGPELDVVAREALPEHRAFAAVAEPLRTVEARLADRGAQLGAHPLRWIRAEVFEGDRPLARIADALDRAIPALERVAEVEGRAPLARVEQRMSFIGRVAPLVSHGLLALLDSTSSLARAVRGRVAELGSARDRLAEARDAARPWKEALARADLRAALELARRWQGRFFRFLFPSFWRLRRLMRDRYDFGARALAPSYVQALEDLERRLDAEDAVAAEEKKIEAELGTEPKPVLESLEAVDDAPDESLVEMLRSPEGEARGRALLERREDERVAREALAELLEGHQDEPVADLVRALKVLRNDLELVGEVSAELTLVRRSCPAALAFLGGHPVHERPVSVATLEHAVVAEAVRRSLATDPTLKGQGIVEVRRQQRSVAQREERFREANAAEMLRVCKERFLEHVRITETPAAKLAPEQKVLKKVYKKGRRALEHEFGKVMRYRSIRDLATSESGSVIRDLKPVWLMSPLSVSDTLPLGGGAEPPFDVVIFDEASQIPLEDAVPAICRAPRTIIVGDEMQLPPTSFFGSGQGDEEGDAFEVEGEDETISYSLDADSLLSHSSLGLSGAMLQWHYRSRDEALIRFCNHAFYGGKLRTIPSTRVPRLRPPILVEEPSEGAAGAERLLERPLSFHHLPKAVYEKRRNPGEARYVAEMLRALLEREDHPTIGVVAFSEAQQSEIEGAIDDLAEEDEAFRRRYEEELERTVDGEAAGLFVKNLENVQGDERDVIILSICYGPDARGQMRMNFGPINKMGGEKRLNVIFSRAKKHMAVVSTIRHERITNEWNTGAKTLKGYLRYAEACSTGDAAEADAVIRGLSGGGRGEDERAPHPVAVQLAEALGERGFQTALGIGTGEFFVDLAVREGDRWASAVLVDAPHRSASPGPLAHYHVRPSVLAAFGWHVVSVLPHDWCTDPEATLERLVRQLKRKE